LAWLGLAWLGSRRTPRRTQCVRLLRQASDLLAKVQPRASSKSLRVNKRERSKSRIHAKSSNRSTREHHKLTSDCSAGTCRKLAKPKSLEAHPPNQKPETSSCERRRAWVERPAWSSSARWLAGRWGSRSEARWPEALSGRSLRRTIVIDQCHSVCACATM